MSLALPLDDVHDALRPVRLWLYGLAVLVLMMVVVGGATRLTGSGLSITEWRPVTGALPPLSHQEWLSEFDKYRAIPQYQMLNRGMSLAEFQFIYWWEWGHRQLGRFIGLFFAVPFLFFYARGLVRGRLALACLGLGLLGGLQGFIGWIMVASGLKPGMLAVAPVKLMLHLTLASVIFTLLLLLARSLDPRPVLEVHKAFWIRHRILIGFVLVQIALGALVAGSKAGLTFNTWPLMDGRFVPSPETLFAVQPFIENFVDNPALVQFNHRMMAYLVVAFALFHVWRSRHEVQAFPYAMMIAALIGAQAALGIVTLLLVVPLWAGILHQAMALVVLAGLALVPRSA